LAILHAFALHVKRRCKLTICDEASPYLETSVVSYLVARPWGNPLALARQQITREWWRKRRASFEVFVSDIVEREVTAGDPVSARARLEIVLNFPGLPVPAEAERLAARLVAVHALPPNAADDALHIAVAAVHGMDYLLTWNCRHIANAEMQKAIRSTCLVAGYEPRVHVRKVMESGIRQPSGVRSDVPRSPGSGH
jgi:predicted nucleic acid-binding protein